MIIVQEHNRKSFQECGSPILSFREENHPDGSVTIIPIDENNTKVKIMEKIDHFVEEYTGEDLRELCC